jgi:hypothetical protein
MRLRAFRVLCQVIGVRLAAAAADATLAGDFRSLCTPRPQPLADLARDHLVTPAMAAAVEDLGLGDRLPDEMRAFLAAARALAVARNERLCLQLHDAALRLNHADIVPVPLGGAIRLVDGLYPDAAWRFSPQLDLLIPARRLGMAEQALGDAGWRRAADGPGSEAHRVILRRPGAEAPLRLHLAPLRRAQGGLLPAARLLARAQLEPLGEATLLLPALEDQLVHLAAHATPRHACLLTGRFLLRDVVELGLLARRAGPGTLAAAGARFAAARRRATWEVSLELLRACLPELAAGAVGEAVALRHVLLARRMLLQQGAPTLMRGLEPVGRLAARALGHAAGGPLAAGPDRDLARMLNRLQLP